MSKGRDIVVAADNERLSQITATMIAKSLVRSIESRGLTSVVLAGGATPIRVYQILAADPMRNTLDWRYVHLFFSDERMVPPDDPASNYGMVSRELVSGIPIPPENIHRIRGELPAVDAAREYQAELEKWFGGRTPRFDMVVLGVGEDGHIASLFPGTPALIEVARMAIGSFIPQINGWRVTLTLPVLLHARETFILVTGERKAPVVAKSVEVRERLADIPASLIRPTQGTVHWMLDAGAASLISHATLRANGIPPDGF